MTERSRIAQGATSAAVTFNQFISRREATSGSGGSSDAAGSRDYGRDGWERVSSGRINGGDTITPGWGESRDREREMERDKDLSLERSGDRYRSSDQERERDRGRDVRDRERNRGSSPGNAVATGDTRSHPSMQQQQQQLSIRRVVSAGGDLSTGPVHQRSLSGGYVSTHRRNSGPVGTTPAAASEVGGGGTRAVSGAAGSESMSEPNQNKSSDGWSSASGVARRRSASSSPPLRVTNPEAFKGIGGDGTWGSTHRGSHVGGEGEADRRRVSSGGKGQGYVAIGRDRGGVVKGDGSEDKPGGPPSASAAASKPRPVPPPRRSSLAAIIAARSQDSPIQAVSWMAFDGGVFFLYITRKLCYGRGLWSWHTISS